MADLLAVQRRRRTFVVAVPVVVVLGAALRFGLSGWPADAAGGVAYTALIYVLAGALRPAWSPWPLAAVAVSVSCAVELAQLTGGPQALVDWWSPMRLAVGQSFSAADLPVYAAGGVMAAVTDLAVSRAGPPRRRSSPTTKGSRRKP